MVVPRSRRAHFCVRSCASCASNAIIANATISTTAFALQNLVPALELTVHCDAQNCDNKTSTAHEGHVISKDDNGDRRCCDSFCIASDLHAYMIMLPSFTIILRYCVVNVVNLR